MNFVEYGTFKLNMFIKEVITSCFRYLRYSSSSFVITLNSCESRLLRAKLVQKSPSIISPALLLTETSWIMSARQPPRSPPLPSVEFSKELIGWYWSQTGEGRQGDERHKAGLPDGWVMMMRGEWRNVPHISAIAFPVLSSSFIIVPGRVCVPHLFHFLLICSPLTFLTVSIFSL